MNKSKPVPTNINIVELPLVDELPTICLYTRTQIKKTICFDKSRASVSIVELESADSGLPIKDKCTAIIDGRHYTINLPYKTTRKIVFG